MGAAQLAGVVVFTSAAGSKIRYQRVLKIPQTSGRSQALRALLQLEQERGPDFLRLGNALSPLYPGGSPEKRLPDEMLLAVPR